MDFDPKDYDIVKLLTKLKKPDEAYPLELLASRRQKYTRRVAEIGMGFGVSDGLKNTIKSSKSGAFTPRAGGLLETALVIAIVAEASTAAYFYRDKIANLIQSYSSTPQFEEVTLPPTFSSPLPEYNATETPKSTELPENTKSTTITNTPAGTPTLTENTNVNNNNNLNNQTVSTPNPNGNNGNHFGQTPKPERTKKDGENNPGNDGNGNGNGKDK